MEVADMKNPSLKTPEWLEALENKKKRSHKLAHEIGAGAPCLVCKENCKGLNLHFWRKLCIECKCRKEDHEIEEEEDNAQFEILFGAKKVKRTTLRFNAQNKSFDWIPPNIPLELAVDYLNSIPQSKLPISNSEGARYRKQQLERQIPLHDVDPCVCHNLSEKEKNEFNKYLDNLRNNVIGQGKIMKFHSQEMIKESLTSVPSINSMIANEEYSSKLTPLAAQLQSCLSVNKVPEYKASSQAVNLESHSLGILSKGNLSNKSSQTIKSHYLENNQNMKINNEDSSLEANDLKFKVKNPFSNDSRSNSESPLLSLNNKNTSLHLKTPSSFINRLHELNDKQNNNPEISQEDKNSNKETQNFLEGNNLHYNYSEIPCANSSDLENSGNNQTLRCNPVFYKENLDKLKSLNLSSSEVPFVPLQETENMPKKLDVISKEPDNLDVLNSFPAPPSTCQECLQILYPEEIVVQAERCGNLALWHAKCFICETCKELLVDLMYFFYKGKVYCGRHYAEITNIPRCYACDELIFVKEYTCAEGKSYHVRHFCCFICDQPLGGKQYIPKDNQPICLDCFQNKFGKTCHTCSLPIAPGEQRVSWKHLDYHVSPECFCCAKCSKSLLGGRFVVKNDKTFCSKECASNFLE